MDRSDTNVRNSIRGFLRRSFLFNKDKGSPDKSSVREVPKSSPSPSSSSRDPVGRVVSPSPGIAMLDLRECDYRVFVVGTNLKRPSNLSSCGPNGSIQKLGAVHSHHLEVEVPVSTSSGGQGITKILLRDVPIFLINAFNEIAKPENLRMEGIFRKEGNAGRVNRNHVHEFIGELPLDPDLSVYDICVMVKRFLRHLNPPLIHGSSLKERLFTLAQRPIETISLQDITLLFEGDRSKMKKMPRPPLSDAHLGTLGFVMRQLKRIAHHSDKHQMTVDNLAIVFGPTLFEEDRPTKKKAGSQEDLLNARKTESQLWVDVVRLLIRKADWIGLPTNHYVTSMAPTRRSASLAPSPRHALAYDLVNRPTSNSMNQAMAKQVVSAQDRVKKERRSSSTFREVFKRVVRATSPTRRSQDRRRRTIEVNSPAVSSSRLSTGPVRQRSPDSPRIKHHLDFDGVDPDVRTPQNRPSTTPENSSSSRQSRSHHRRVTPRHPTPGPGANSSRQDQVTTTPKLTDVKKSEELCLSAATANYVVDSQKSPWQDNPVSMLGADAFDADLREQRKPPRRRRHTTPVKGSALRRNQPNVERVGLRRVTGMANSEREHEEKENDPHHSEEHPMDETVLFAPSKEEEKQKAEAEAAKMLEQKGMESRMRRAKNRERSTAKLLSNDCEGKESFVSPKDRLDGVRREEKKLVDMATSPMVLTSNEMTAAPLRHPGSAIVLSRRLYNTSPPTSPHKDETGDTRKEELEQQTLKSPSNASELSAVEDSKPPEEKIMKPDSPFGPTNIVVRSPAAPALPCMPPPPQPAAATTTRCQMKPPALKSQHSLDSQLSMQESRAFLSERGVRVRAGSPIQKNTSFVKPSSRVTRPPLPPVFGRSISNRGGTFQEMCDMDFANSDSLKQEILRDRDATQNDRTPTMPAASEHQRPSVVFIRDKNRGLVQERIHLFNQFNPMEPISGRSSAMSTRSSLGGLSVAGSIDSRTEDTKPWGPPVGHAINMTPVRMSPSRSASYLWSSPTSSPRQN